MFFVATKKQEKKKKTFSEMSHSEVCPTLRTLKDNQIFITAKDSVR